MQAINIRHIRSGIYTCQRPRKNSGLSCRAHKDLNARSSLMATTTALMLLSGNAMADTATMQELFTAKCAGCHTNGGNIVQPGATLFAEDLKKNGIDGPEALFNIIYSGKDKMPGYGTDCAPRGKCSFGARLGDDDIRGLASYVEERSAASWK